MRTLRVLAAMLLAAGFASCGEEEKKPECSGEVSLSILFDSESGGNVSVHWVEPDPTDEDGQLANVETWDAPFQVHHFCTTPAVELGSIVLLRFETSGELCILIEGEGAVDLEYTADQTPETAMLEAWTTSTCFPSDGEVWVTAHDPATDTEED